jgi:hypothetical protein
LRIASGAFLVFIGLLIALGRLQRFNIFLFRLAGWLENWKAAHPWQVRLSFTLVFLIPAILLGISYVKRARSAGRLPLLPGRAVLLLLFLALAVVTASGVLDPTGFFTFWFTYQGI